MNKSQKAATLIAKALTTSKNIGISKGNIFTEVDWLGDAVRSSLATFVKETVKNIETTQTIYKGAILNMDILEQSGAMTVVGAKELLFQNYGVMGAKNKTFASKYSYRDKRPPLDPILEWVKGKAARSDREVKAFGTKGALKTFTTGDTEEEQLSHAYAVRELIYQNGIKPKDLFTTPLKNLSQNINVNLDEILNNATFPDDGEVFSIKINL